MRVTNIQRFSLHDGPGIRTTVFCKGCALRCPWCSNPENINNKIEQYENNGRRSFFGEDLTDDEIFEIVMKDRAFYSKDGGVTFSGGEALLQLNRSIPMLSKLKNAGVTIALETSLFAPSDNLLQVIPFVDFFYVDMKIIDEAKCETIEKGDLSLFFNNLDILLKYKKVNLRIPVIRGYTDDTNNRNRIMREIQKRQSNILKVELINGHNLAESKYISLGLPVPDICKVTDELLKQYKAELETVTLSPVVICKI